MRQSFALFLLIASLALLPIAGHAQQPEPLETLAAPPAPNLLALELLDRGAAALNTQDFDRTILDTSLFLLFNPTFSQGYYVRARAYLGQENMDLALRDVEQALTSAGDFPEYESAVYALRANIHARTNELAQAAADYTFALDLFPNIDLYANRALVYLSLEDFDKALADFDSAISEVDDDPVLRVYRAFTHTRLGNMDAAALDYYAFVQLVETRRVENPALIASQPSFVMVSQGVVHQFEIEGERNQLLSVVAQGRPGDSIDPLLILLDDDGEVLAADDDSGGSTTAAILNVALPSNGTYTVLVTHSLGGFDGQVAVLYEVAE